MRHLGILTGAALVAFAPGVASAQMGAPAGAPMQAGSWGQGGWQPGGSAAPTFEPGAPGYVPQQGYAPQGDWHHDHMMGNHGDYRRLARGKRLPDGYMDPRYAVTDWADWGFAAPAPGTHWVRYYDDGMLVDARGRIVDARYGVDWDRGYRRGPRGYGMHGGYAGGYGYPAPGASSYRAGPNTVVTTRVVPVPPPAIVAAPAYGFGYYGGGAQVVGVTPGVAVTTTTTTTDYETIYKSVAVRHRVWRKPVRHYTHPHCARATSCPVQGS